MDLEIANKIALVMASSSGLGKAIAQELVAEGVRVVISGRNSDSLEELSKDIGAFGFLTFDLVQQNAARELVHQCQQRFGSVDILVTNAGGPPKGKFSDISNEQWHTGFQSLFLGFVDSVRAVLPEMMVKSWGRIIAVTSIAGKEPIPGLTISNGIRAGLHGLINSLSKEVACHNITVNAVLPTYTETERLKELGIGVEDMLRGVPAKRLGSPRELGKLVAFLSSEHAGFITGQALAYDGGSLGSI